MPNEPVDELSVRLTIDANEYIDSLDSALSRGEGVAKASAEEIEKTLESIGDEFSALGDEMVETAEAFGISMEQVAGSLIMANSNLGKTKDELVALGNAAKDAIGQQVLTAIEDFETKAASIGLILGDDELENIRNIFEAQREIVATSREYADVVDELTPRLLLQAATNAKIETSIDAVTDSYVKSGQAIPFDRLANLRTHMIRVVDAARAEGASIEDVTDRLNELVQAEIDVAQQGEGGGGPVRGLSGIFSGGVKQFFASIVAGVGIFQLLQKGLASIKRIISESTQVFIEYGDAVWDLNAAVSVLQLNSAEAAGTQAEWLEFVKEIRSEFRLTSTEANSVAASVAQMGANFDLSGDQLQEIGRRGIALGKIFREDIQGSAEKLTRFVTQGYAQGLETMGFNLDKAVLKQTAWNMGLRTSFDDLTEVELQLVRYNTVLEQSDLWLEKAGDQGETFSQQLLDLDNSATVAKEGIGALIAPINLFWERAKLGAVNTFGLIIASFVLFTSTLIAHWGGLISAGDLWVEKMRDIFSFKGINFKTIVSEFLEAYSEGFSRAQKVIAESMSIGETFADDFGNTTDSIKQHSAEFVTAMGDIGDAIQDAELEWTKGLDNIQSRYDKTLDDLRKRTDRRRTDREVDLQRDLIEIDRKTAEDRLQTTRDFQNDELELRERHRLDIANLEEDFILNLGDAVRERDARQVLNLTRRFNTEKRQREREKDLRVRELKAGFTNELAEIERERQIRKALRLQEQEEELEDIQLAEARALADAVERRDRDLNDLRTSIDAKIRTVADGAVARLKIEGEELRILYDMLNQAYGAGGWVEGFYQRYRAIVAAANPGGVGGSKDGGASARRGNQPTNTSFQSVPTRSEFPVSVGTPVTSRQRGGTFFATSQSLLSVGEGSPERVDITPLSVSTGAPRAGFGGGAGGGRMAIDLRVAADDRLIVEVAEQAMGAVADVFVSIEREDRRRSN